MKEPNPSGRVIGRRQSVGVAMASVYAAAVSYVVLLIAARALDPATNAEFLVFWSLLFGAFGIVTGITAESARAVHDGGDDRRGGTAPIVLSGLVVGTVLVAVVGASGPLWMRFVLPDHTSLLVVVVLAAATYSGHLALWGVLTGLRRWREMAALMALESTVRLGLVVLVVLVGSVALVPLAISSAASALTWTVTLVVPSVRALLARRSDLDVRRQATQFAIACAASACSAILTVGFPTLLALTSPRPQVLAAAGTILAVTLTRAPLMVPLTAFQGVVLTYFLQHRTRGASALTPVLGIVAGLALLGAGLAWAVGADVYSALLGRSYSINATTLAALVLAAGGLAALTLTGVCCLAVRRSAGYALGWVVATGVTAGLLAVPGDLTGRVIMSLAIGPLTGIAVHLLSLRKLSGDPELLGPDASTPPATG